LAAALKAWSEADLEILTLHFADGFSQTEIAGQLGVSKQAVSKKICSLKNFFDFTLPLLPGRPGKPGERTRDDLFIIIKASDSGQASSCDWQSRTGHDKQGSQ
jgi:hypothetical protein